MRWFAQAERSRHKALFEAYRCITASVFTQDLSVFRLFVGPFARVRRTTAVDCGIKGSGRAPVSRFRRRSSLAVSIPEGLLLSEVKSSLKQTEELSRIGCGRPFAVAR